MNKLKELASITTKCLNLIEELKELSLILENTAGIDVIGKSIEEDIKVAQLSIKTENIDLINTAVKTMEYTINVLKD